MIDEDDGFSWLIFECECKARCGTALTLEQGGLRIEDADGNLISIDLPDELYNDFWQAIQVYQQSKGKNANINYWYGSTRNEQ